MFTLFSSSEPEHHCIMGYDSPLHFYSTDKHSFTLHKLLQFLMAGVLFLSSLHMVLWIKHEYNEHYELLAQQELSVSSSVQES